MENRIHNITENTTLGELLGFLDLGKRPAITPTPRQLRETGGKPVAVEERCKVYQNGWAVYDNGSGCTVVWLPDCVDFTYSFVELKGEEAGIVPDEETVPVGLLESQPWPIAVTLVGDHRVENNLLNRTGSRKGTKANEDILYGSGEGEDSLDDRILDEIARLSIYSGGNPENAYIRKESFQEALAAMTEKQRQVFVLYYWYGYNHEEIAKIMKCVISVVNGHLKAAAKKAEKFL